MQKAQQTQRFAFEMRWQRVASLQDRFHFLLLLPVASREQQSAVCIQSKVFRSESQMCCTCTLYDKHGVKLEQVQV